MKIAYAAAAAATLLATAASADTVYNSSLPNVSGTNGVSTATTTTTTPTGTTTSVVGLGGGANRYGATPVANQWEQENVGGNASVGITTQYARSGNGSIAFSGTDGNSKADMEYYFSTPFSLSGVSSMSYDWYRSSTSTTDPSQMPALRLLVTNGTQYSALIYELVYNGIPTPGGVQTAPTDSWQTSLIDGTTTFWSNNNNMNHGTAAACPDCYLSLSQWQSLNSTWSVYGLSTGIGSGWSGSFSGAVDNISYTLATGVSRSFNFEVAAAAAPTPEPATWAMMIVGFGAVGAGLRRRAQIAARA